LPSRSCLNWWRMCCEEARSKNQMGILYLGVFQYHIKQTTHCWSYGTHNQHYQKVIVEITTNNTTHYGTKNGTHLVLNCLH
jgi:hypothetical protein